MVKGLRAIKFTSSVCQGCILGKHLEQTFEKGKTQRASSPFGLIQSDIMGPFLQPSISKARYELTFIDDFSRFTWDRIPHKAVKGTTPFECWTGNKLKVSHLRIFGSRAWAHILTDKKKALEPQSVEYLFFGYPHSVKGYILLDSHTEKFLVARSVKFEEESLHDFSTNPVEELLVPTDEEESETSSRTLEKKS
eukprot:PITA_09322